jgi:hypothetical protein
MARFIFNRFRVEASEKIENKLQFMLDGMTTESKTSYLKHAYKLVDVNVKNKFISGFLIKYDPYSVDEVFDDAKSKLSTDTIKNKVIAKSFFIVDYDNGLLIFEEIPNLISKNTFISRFKELFIDNHKDKRKVLINISGIVEQYSFLERVKDLKKIEKITLNLVPSNPHFADRWEIVDERFKKLNIGKYREIQETKNNEGIIIDEETESKILMSEDGYGDTFVLGKDENNILTTISTKSKERTVTLDIPKSIFEQGLVSIINFMEKTISKIKDRTNNE